MTTHIANTNFAQILSIFRKSYPQSEVPTTEVRRVFNYLIADEAGYDNTTEAAEDVAIELDYLDDFEFVTPEWVYDLTILILADEGD